MRGTTRDRNSVNNGVVGEKVVVTHSWLPYTILAILYALTAIGWFATFLATVGYTSSNIQQLVPNTQGNSTYVSVFAAAFFSFINLYVFRMLALFASLAVTYSAERHYLSRGAAWTSWIMNVLLLFSWLATDLPFVYSTFTYFTGGIPTSTQTGSGDGYGYQNDSFRTHYCSVNSTFWCGINTAHGIFSVIAGTFIGLTWMWSCYQLKRARGVSNLLLTWPEVLLINLTVFGMLGYMVWTLSSINLGTTRMFNVFGFLESQQQINTWRMNWSSLIWGNYLIHAAFIASLSSAAFVSFGATTAPRTTALIINWISFMCVFPAAIYLDRNQNDIGSCNGSYGNDSLRCPSLNGVAAGMTICAVINFLQGLTMFALLAQAETADFAIDMYGDKARAIDDARSTGTMPMQDHIAQPAPLTSVGAGVPLHQNESIPLNEARRSSASNIYGTGAGTGASRRNSEDMVPMANIQPAAY